MKTFVLFRFVLWLGSTHGFYDSETCSGNYHYDGKGGSSNWLSGTTPRFYIRDAKLEAPREPDRTEFAFTVYYYGSEPFSAIVESTSGDTFHLIVTSSRATIYRGIVTDQSDTSSLSKCHEIEVPNFFENKRYTYFRLLQWRSYPRDMIWYLPNRKPAFCRDTDQLTLSNVRFSSRTNVETYHRLDCSDSIRQRILRIEGPDISRPTTTPRTTTTTISTTRTTTSTPSKTAKTLKPYLM